MNPSSSNPHATQELAALLMGLRLELYRANPGRTEATLDAAQEEAITTQTRRLLEQGADPCGSTKTSGGQPFLAAAADSGSSHLVQMLLDAGADPNQATDDSGEAPLHLACNGAIVRALIQAGANPNSSDKNGCLPLVGAVGKSNLETMEALLAAGADPDCTNSNGEPVLHIAALLRERDTLQKLLDGGADPDATDQKQWNVETRMRRNSLVDEDEQSVRRVMLEAARLARSMEPATAAPRRHRL